MKYFSEMVELKEAKYKFWNITSKASISCIFAKKKRLAVVQSQEKQKRIKHNLDDEFPSVRCYLYSVSA